MDKSWMQLRNRLSPDYKKGVQKFLDFAWDRVSIEGNMQCPCIKCNNVLMRTREDVKADLIIYGIAKNYTIWYHHGEEFSYNNAKGREPSRLEMFELTHTHENDGTAVDERSKNVMEALSDNVRLNDEEIYYKVIPKERPGRVRGLGCNVTYSQLYGCSKDKNVENEKKVQGLEAQMAEQNEQIQKMVEEKEQMHKELEKQKEEMDNMNGQVGFLYSFIQTMCPNFCIPPNGASDSSARSIHPTLTPISDAT